MNIIPQPKRNEGGLLKNDILSGTQLYTNVNGFLLEYVQTQFSSNIVQKDISDFPFILISNEFELEADYLPDVLEGKEEGYLLKIDKNGVFITSQSVKGLFYGIQSYLQLKQQGYDKELEVIDWPDNTIRGFHFELRFGIPKFERILEIIDEVCKYKFNTLLMELEDKFPYEGIEGIVSKNALNKDQMNEVIKYASDRFMEIIPLQQTLGHVEYVLKNENYYHLREVRGDGAKGAQPFALNSVGSLAFNDIDEFCPSNEESYKLIEKMCREIADKYPSSRYIHIGCDEAWNLLNCNLCKAKYGKEGRVFIEHTNRVSRIIKSLNRVPVIWDDMLRDFSDKEFELLDKDIVIMCWLYYSEDFNKGVSLIKKYKEFGLKVIGASSAKCAEGANINYLDMPNFKERLVNINDWSKLSTKYDLMGIITTIWSNYTGTIAPPHPFFDTMWYPLVYSAEKYWNVNSSNDDFEKRFLENYYGVDGITECFGNEYEGTYKKAVSLVESCKRNKYAAQVYKFMTMLSLYRLKNLAIYREMYKLFNNSSSREKDIVMRKIKEVEVMREYMKTEITNLISKYYNNADTKEFIDSRFFMDDVLYEFVHGKLKS